MSFWVKVLIFGVMIIMLKNMKPTIRNDDFSTICFGAKSILISGNLSKSLSILQLSKELQDDNLIAAGGILYFLGRHRDESSCLILNVYARFYISAFLWCHCVHLFDIFFCDPFSDHSFIFCASLQILWNLKAFLPNSADIRSDRIF